MLAEAGTGQPVQLEKLVQYVELLVSLVSHFFEGVAPRCPSESPISWPNCDMDFPIA